MNGNDSAPRPADPTKIAMLRVAYTYSRKRLTHPPDPVYEANGNNPISQSDPIRSKSDPIRSNLNPVCETNITNPISQSDSIRSHQIQSAPIRSNQLQSDPTRSDAIRSNLDPVCETNLTNPIRQSDLTSRSNGCRYKSLMSRTQQLCGANHFSRVRSYNPIRLDLINQGSYVVLFVSYTSIFVFSVCVCQNHFIE